MRNFILAILIFFSSMMVANAAIQTEEVSYQAGDVTFKGYLAYDDGTEELRPGVIVVHEWWGHNDYARKRARMLAELGYTALAIDMYGDGKLAEHPDDAGAFASAVMENAAVAKERFLAGLAVLKKHKTVDMEKIAAIGYCFGGATVLNMARMGVDIDGVVSFHGSLGTSTPAQPGAVKAKVLVCHGAADSFITEEQIAAFKKEMEEAGADYTFTAYEGARHSFTNPQADALAAEFGLGLAYEPQADKQSWEDMKDFFQRIFK